MSRCRSCDAPIRWVHTASGKATPLNAEPDDERGNVLIAVVGGEEVATVIADDHELRSCRANRTPLYLSHFANCPHAAEHRRPLHVA